MPRQSTYKPLLFTTTLRNPERLKSFLIVLAKYNGQILNDTLAEEIAGKVIETGLYTPRNLSARVRNKIKNQKQLTDREVAKILRENPQNHKEAGFTRGWSSRFDTWFKIAKELGFVFYRSGEEIRFSEIGLKLADSEHPEFEQQAFLNAFVKYQSNSPFRRVLNENVPLVLLLDVVTKLNADEDFNDAGISKEEIPLVIYWKDNDSEKLYQRIKKLRHDFGFSPSWEVIVQICCEEIMEGTDIARSYNSILTDYPDEFIRKMRLTGLISVRGGGRFIGINTNEQAKVDYVLANYSEYEKYDDEESYFEYISTVDENLISLEPKTVSIAEQDDVLGKWINIYTWSNIRKELLNLSSKRLTKDTTLKYLANPVRLEFLTALAVKSQFPDVTVVPNYPIDDEGIPTSTAGGAGNTGDIECFDGENGVLIEVTMSQGRAQTMMEIWPVCRHLEEFSKKIENSMCYFVAPTIFIDSVRQIDFARQKENLFISPKTIKEFIVYLESSDDLYDIR